MKFEEVLPALREGKKIRRTCWEKDDWIVESNEFYYKDERGVKYPFQVASINADDWEIVPEPKIVANYLCPTGWLIGIEKNDIYERKTYEVGTQPEGAVLVPGSEREVEK